MAADTAPTAKSAGGTTARSPWRRLAPVAIVFGALFAIMLARESTRPRATGIDVEAELIPLARRPFDPAECVRIEIAAPGGDGAETTLSFDTARGVWYVDAAFEAPGHTARAEALVAALREATGELRSDDPGALARFDLTPARGVRLTAFAPNAEILTEVLVGRTSGALGAFVRILGTEGVDDGAVYAVTSDLRGLLGLPPTAAGGGHTARPDAAFFHDTTFPALNLPDPERLTLRTERWEVAFERHDGQWDVLRGASAGGAAGAPPFPVNPGGVTNVVQALGGGIETLRLLDPAEVLPPRGDAAPYRLHVALAGGGYAAVTGLAEPRPAGGVRYSVRLDVDQDPVVVWELSRAEWLELFPLGGGLFELGRLPVSQTGLGRIVVEHDGRRFDAFRERGWEQNPWIVNEPRWPLDVRQTAVSRFAAQLEGIKAVDFVATEDAPRLGDPRLTVRFGSDAVAVESLPALRVHGPAPGPAGERMARFPGRDGVLVITDSMENLLVPPYEQLFESRLFARFEKSNVKRIRIAVRSTAGEWSPERDWRREPRGTKWTAHTDGPTAEPLPADAANELIERLFTLRIEQSADPARAREPALRLTVTDTRDAELRFDLSRAAGGYRILHLGGGAFRVRDPGPLATDEQE